MMRRLRWAALCAVMLAAPLLAGDWRAALPSAQQQGSGDFTWWGFRLYTARLWTDGHRQDWARPFALELLYHRALTRDSLVQASLQEMRRLGDGGVTPEQLASWAQIMQTAFTDVRPGMRITGLYLPGAGCRFYVDGTLSAEVRDAAFAEAFFAIWLDPRARDPQLRLHLLGQAGDGGPRP
ncbi:chalcone isomerase family protein [Pseudomonas sp. NPDC089408]|uniref:chalcone isomerase family protein n=1 Tax=Pseudomonas sp. NPDC089408 TaxID=3364465 RepID=UPI0037F84422